jgi:hypothetical protein
MLLLKLHGVLTTKPCVLFLLCALRTLITSTGMWHTLVYVGVAQTAVYYTMGMQGRLMTDALAAVICCCSTWEQSSTVMQGTLKLHFVVFLCSTLRSSGTAKVYCMSRTSHCILLCVFSTVHSAYLVLQQYTAV